MSWSFRHLQAGDRVRLIRPPSRQEASDPDELRMYEFTIESTESSSRFGRAILSPEHPGHFYEDDEWEVEILRYANGLPDAAFFAWFDSEHEVHAAIRIGDPANQVWKYNGIQYSTEDMMKILNGAVPVPLVVRS